MKKFSVCLVLLFLIAGSLFAAELMAGAGIACITPTADMYPQVYGTGNRQIAFIGTAGDIYVRVIALSDKGEDTTIDDTYLIVSTETCGGPYSPDFVDFLSEKTGVPRDNIFWTATHLHSVPDAWYEDWGDYLDIEIRTDNPAVMLEDLSKRNRSRWCVLVQKQLLEAANEAIAEMRPAEVALGTSTSYINVNRDTVYDSNLVQNPFDPMGPQVSGALEGYNGQGFSDKTLSVVEFRDKNTKEPITFIVHYAMHNTLLYGNDYYNPAYFEAHGIRYADPEEITEGTYVLNDPEATVLGSPAEKNVAYCEPYQKTIKSLDSLTNADNVLGIVAANGAIHPDIGGLVSQYIEANNPDAVALWVSGAAGDQNPVLRNTFNIESPYTGEVLEIPVDGGFIPAAVYYAAIQYQDVKDALAEIGEEEFESETPIGTAYGTDTIQPIDTLYYAYDAATGTYADPEPYPEIPLFLKVLRVGDITFAGSPVELYNAIGVAMRDETDLGGAPAENTLVINHCWTNAAEDPYLIYYPDDAAIERNSNRWVRELKYPTGVINDAMKNLLVETWEAAEPEI